MKRMEDKRLRVSSPNRPSSNQSLRSISEDLSSSPKKQGNIVFKQFDKQVENKLTEMATHKLTYGLNNVQLVRFSTDLGLLFLKSNALNSSTFHLSDALSHLTKLITELGYEELCQRDHSRDPLTIFGPITYSSQQLSPIKHEKYSHDKKVKEFTEQCKNLSNVILNGLAMTQFKLGNFDTSETILQKLQQKLQERGIMHRDCIFVANVMLCLLYIKTNKPSLLEERLQETERDLNSVVPTAMETRCHSEKKKMIFYLKFKNSLKSNNIEACIDMIVEMLNLCEQEENDDKILYLFKLLVSLSSRYSVRLVETVSVMDKYVPLLSGFPFDSQLPKIHKKLLYSILIQSSVIYVKLCKYDSAYTVLINLYNHLMADANSPENGIASLDFITVQEHGDFLRKLGTVCLGMNKSEEGISWFKKAVVLYASQLGKSHPLTKSSIQRTAELIFHFSNEK
ncbi:hypothetical protein C9374_013941 [Naegleria lovaniensis]|uniref:Uncharacterized protein n=1 Tax=Naegleria lovaniensis TaxID=51637 RepID=A0AA88KQ68_NAELO|nr:uncharacterized protein C9374_013941 [Naegleria lovaniensis]KAG2389381.1 hypothetical protein C9374_013941 [Naegleria lovaniensis]